MLWVYDHSKYGISFSTWAVYTSDYDVYRRQILTYKDGPRAQGVKLNCSSHVLLLDQKEYCYPLPPQPPPPPPHRHLFIIQLINSLKSVSTHYVVVETYCFC